MRVFKYISENRNYRNYHRGGRETLSFQPWNIDTNDLIFPTLKNGEGHNDVRLITIITKGVAPLLIEHTTPNRLPLWIGNSS